MTDPPQEPPEYRITVNDLERARLCLRAAQLRADGQPYSQIATDLSLDSPAAAKRCAEVGYSLGPSEDLRMLRQRAALELDLIRQQLRKIIPEEGDAS
jgi:hypothetical protein